LDGVQRRTLGRHVVQQLLTEGACDLEESGVELLADVLEAQRVAVLHEAWPDSADEEAVASAPEGSWGRCPSLADYVRGPAATGAPPVERANVAFYEAAARVNCVPLVNVVPFSRGSVILLFAL